VKYRQLGRSGLRVSALCLGSMNFGPRTSEDESFQILNRALDCGINFIDTADQYGGRLGVGVSEIILGKWFAQDPGRRDKVVLATKVYEPMSDDINDRGLSARHIQRACEASLKRLGVEHIDLYQMHHIDRCTPMDEIWQAMELLIRQGKITYVGSSNFPGWKIAQANERALARHQFGLVSEQSIYNLIERRAELEVIPACLEYGVGVLTWSPLAGGLLAAQSGNEAGRRQSEALRATTAHRSEQLTSLGLLCQEIEQAPSAVALAWLLHQKGIVSTVIGPATVAQLLAVSRVPELILSVEFVQRLDKIFPACGPAPEAYAW
jgi:NDP-hexose 2,3-enoyl reductase